MRVGGLGPSNETRIPNIETDSQGEIFVGHQVRRQTELTSVIARKEDSQRRASIFNRPRGVQEGRHFFFCGIEKKTTQPHHSRGIKLVY